MIHVFTTTTNFMPLTHFVIADDRYEEYLQTYRQGMDLDFLTHGVNEGWAAPADDEGNPL